jgi:hypothetical protein
MNKSCRAASVLGLFLYNGAVYAADPPTLPFDDVDWNARVLRKPAVGVTIGKLKVVFEKTLLRDVWEEAGGTIAEAGDAAEHSFWLCYTLASSTGFQRLWLSSNAEMDGPDHAISGVTGERVTDGPTADCPTLSASLQPVSLDGGLWLDMPESRLTAKFKVKPGIHGNWRGYLYAGKRSQGCGTDSADVLNSLEWTVIGGSIDVINAGQTTSC